MSLVTDILELKNRVTCQSGRVPRLVFMSPTSYNQLKNEASAASREKYCFVHINTVVDLGIRVDETLGSNIWVVHDLFDGSFN